MVPSEQQLRTHLVPDESLRGVASGRVIDGSAGGRVAIALTDRRLLCLSGDGELVDVDYGSICSIRSWSRSRLGLEGIDSRLLVGLGAAVSGTAFLAGLLYVARLRPNGGLIGVGLALLIVAGALAFEGVRRRRRERPVGRNQLLGGILAGAVAALAFLVTIAFVSRVVVPLLLVATVAGLALAEYANRHDNQYDGVEFAQVREKELTIHTIDGHEIRIVIDADADVDHRLSRLASVESRPGTEAASSRSMAE